MKIVHLICNAHLDPIWLWPWHAGLTEALATARSVCNLLDDYPDLTFTRGESWFYQQIQRHDPELFGRIRTFVEAGRWEIVGGWYVQPDCNQPGMATFEKLVDIGRRYFVENFSRFPEIAYNVDSFGHHASLPAFMRRHGQKYYIMMRPQEHEMTLPARIFQWRGSSDDLPVTTFRIAGAYCTPHGINERHILNSLSELPPGIDHTMCFVGLGDHGGGPSHDMVRWCTEHADSFPGAKLIFSTPSRFFSAIAGQIESLPQVTGELQMHAIGCYSVGHQVKTLQRQAEQNLVRAEAAVPDQRQRLNDAWQHVCFHSFHDTLGGTCIPSAYPAVYADLSSAISVADDLLRHKMTDMALALPNDERQRMIFWNPGPNRFRGYVECEPWLEWNFWKPAWQIEDDRGQVVPYQLMASEGHVNAMTRLLFHCDIAPNQIAVFRFDHTQVGQKSAQTVIDGVKSNSELSLINNISTYLCVKENGGIQIAGRTFVLPHLVLLDDPTDTWSHGVDRYSAVIAARVHVQDTQMVDSGPLMGSIVQTGTIGQSDFEAEWRIYASDPCVYLNLRINWVQHFQILKLIWDLPSACMDHQDGIPGGAITRPADGKEVPLSDWVRVRLADGSAAGVACPDVYALDCAGSQLRMTLLRGPVMAHSESIKPRFARRFYADRGEHTFRFVFTAGDNAAISDLSLAAASLQMPPLMTDLTRGMRAFYIREADA